MRLTSSDELTLLAHPLTGYLEIAARDPGSSPWRAIRRPLLQLVMIGAFVSVTTAGRFTAWHVILAGLGWAFVPVIQIGWLLTLRVRLGRSRTAPETIDLFFAGQGGWHAVALALIAVIVVVPSLADLLHGMHWLVLIAVGAIGALIHGVTTTAAFMRQIWGLTRGQTMRAALIYYLAVSGTVLGYYVWMGQILPLLMPP